MGVSAAPKVLVLLAAGVNCDRETAQAFESAGAETRRVHVNDVIDRPQVLRDYQILVLPGGFSFGDDIASGQVLSRKLKYRLAEPIRNFVEQGKLVIGICNGFQVLVKLGLLPALPEASPSKAADTAGFAAQQAALTFNSSAKFEDRWVYLKTERQSRCVFTGGLDEVIYLPVRHGEGRFIIDAQGLAALKAAGQVVMRYVAGDGEPGDYPANPNGSIDDIAGICDPTGRVFGLMPHPEVFVRPTQHPRWSRGEGVPPAGIEIFKNAVAFLR